MPDPFSFGWHGIPDVDWRAWRAMWGDVSPSARHGVARMMEALIKYGPR